MVDSLSREWSDGLRIVVRADVNYIITYGPRGRRENFWISSKW
jgi:hypothetical protein